MESCACCLTDLTAHIVVVSVRVIVNSSRAHGDNCSHSRSYSHSDSRSRSHSHSDNYIAVATAIATAVAIAMLRGRLFRRWPRRRGGIAPPFPKWWRDPAVAPCTFHLRLFRLLKLRKAVRNLARSRSFTKSIAICFPGMGVSGAEPAAADAMLLVPVVRRAG